MNMKSRYETPTAELLAVSVKDIITVSIESEGSGVSDKWDDLVD